jgi:hypothetical protein
MAIDLGASSVDLGETLVKHVLFLFDLFMIDWTCLQHAACEVTQLHLRETFKVAHLAELNLHHVPHLSQDSPRLFLMSSKHSISCSTDTINCCQRNNVGLIRKYTATANRGAKEVILKIRMTEKDPQI